MGAKELAEVTGIVRIGRKLNLLKKNGGILLSFDSAMPTKLSLVAEGQTLYKGKLGLDYRGGNCYLVYKKPLTWKAEKELETEYLASVNGSEDTISQVEEFIDEVNSLSLKASKECSTCSLEKFCSITA